MYFYLKGTLTQQFKDYIVLEVNHIGYQIFVSNPDNFIINNEYLIYIYRHKREDDEYLVGFTNLDEKSAFLMLISVQGIGPKTALSILKGSNPSRLIDAIRNGEVSYIENIKGVSNKLALQIVIELRGKLETLRIKEESVKHLKIKQALKALGFKNKEIEPVLSNIDLTNLSEELALKEALRSLNK